MTELYAALQPVLDQHTSFHSQQAEEGEEGKERAVQLAIMGLPNVVSHQRKCSNAYAVHATQSLLCTHTVPARAQVCMLRVPSTFNTCKLPPIQSQPNVQTLSVLKPSLSLAYNQLTSCSKVWMCVQWNTYAYGRANPHWPTTC